MLEIGIDSIMPFGKYKGCKIKDMVVSYGTRDYLVWVKNTCKNVKITTEVLDIMKREAYEFSEIQGRNWYENKEARKEACKKSKGYSYSYNDYGQESCPGDYMGMSPFDFM